MDEWDDDTELTAAAAADAVAVSKQLFNYWRRTGKVDPTGRTTPDGRALYRLGDIAEVERETRNSRHSRRGGQRSRRLVFAG